MSIGLGGMAWASFGVNHLDIGAGVKLLFSYLPLSYKIFIEYFQKYANVLMAISNTFASIPGIISPVLTGHLIEHKVSILFFISIVGHSRIKILP